MSYLELVKSMTVEMRDRLNHAVQIGRWPDGSALTNEQKEAIVEALIAYQALHESDRDEPFRVTEKGELRAMKRIKEKSHTHDGEPARESPDEFKLILK
jgi:uncharacterized protein YeaC (DUF1315 family)